MWLLLGLTSAISDASKKVLAKHNTKSFNSLVITWAWCFYSLIILLPLMFVKGVPHLDTTFWVAFSVRIVLDFISLLLYVETIKHSDLSLTLPMLTLTPLFLVFTGLVLNHEFPSLLGLCGVACIVLGTYFLNFKGKDSPLWEPILAIGRDRGSFMMFGVAMLWGVTGSLHKLAISHSNPFFYTGLGTIVLAALYTPVAWFSNSADFKKSFQLKQLPQLVPVGLLDGLTTLTQMIGQNITLTVFVISLKRTSIIFSSVMGWALFKVDIRKRLGPICLMVFGVILIAVGK